MGRNPITVHRHYTENQLSHRLPRLSTDFPENRERCVFLSVSMFVKVRENPVTFNFVSSVDLKVELCEKCVKSKLALNCGKEMAGNWLTTKMSDERRFNAWVNVKKKHTMNMLCLYQTDGHLQFSAENLINNRKSLKCRESVVSVLPL